MIEYTLTKEQEGSITRYRQIRSKANAQIKQINDKMNEDLLQDDLFDDYMSYRSQYLAFYDDEPESFPYWVKMSAEFDAIIDEDHRLSRVQPWNDEAQQAWEEFDKKTERRMRYLERRLAV